MPELYNFSPGLVLARKYEVVSAAKATLSGELYTLNERATGIERTAKFFDPRLDPDNRHASHCARKLHRLRHCDIVTQYRTQETISVAGRDVTFLVSDSVLGQPLAELLDRQPGRRYGWFEGLHLLHALAVGVEKVHGAAEAHGGLRLTNVVVRRIGLGFQVKLLDLSLGRTERRAEAMVGDVLDLLRIFHTALGGARVVSGLPAELRAICCGLRRPLVAERFRDAGVLRRHLETLAWG